VLQNAKFEAKSMKRGTSWAYDGLTQCIDNKILGEGDLDNDELFPILVALVPHLTQSHSTPEPQG